MSKTTMLASGAITAGDEISIELIEPTDTPAVIFVRWPLAPSVTDPGRFPATCNAILAILAAASVRLAEIAQERSNPWSRP
jgi:hypothetical protein